MDSKRAIHGAVAALIATVAVNAAMAGAAQATAGVDGPAGTVTETAQAALVPEGTPAVEAGPSIAGPAEAAQPTQPVEAAHSAETAQAVGTAHAGGVAPGARHEAAQQVYTAYAAYAKAYAAYVEQMDKSARETAAVPAERPATGAAHTGAEPPARPVWTRAGAVRLPATTPATTPAKAAGKAAVPGAKATAKTVTAAKATTAGRAAAKGKATRAVRAAKAAKALRPAAKVTTRTTAKAPATAKVGTRTTARTPAAQATTKAAKAPAAPATTKAAVQAPATAKAPATAAWQAPYRVHRRVWTTSARPAVKVWAPQTPKGRNKAIAYRMVTRRAWPVTQFHCLDSLWTRESNWNHRAQNPSSGAYGIPQALPGNKMVGVGHDWRVNPATQIRWGLKYIRGRYGSPCGAWGHFRSHNWY